MYFVDFFKKCSKQWTKYHTHVAGNFKGTLFCKFCISWKINYTHKSNNLHVQWFTPYFWLVHKFNLSKIFTAIITCMVSSNIPECKTLPMMDYIQCTVHKTSNLRFWCGIGQIWICEICLKLLLGQTRSNIQVWTCTVHVG